MQAEPRWFALIAGLVLAAIAFPLFSGDLWRGFPPAVLAFAMAALLVRDRRAPEAPASSNRYRDRRAVAIFIGLAVVTAVAAIVVAVLQAL